MLSQGMSEAELLALSAPEQHMAAMAAQLQAPDQAAGVGAGYGSNGGSMKPEQVRCMWTAFTVAASQRGRAWESLCLCQQAPETGNGSCKRNHVQHYKKPAMGTHHFDQL